MSIPDLDNLAGFLFWWAITFLAYCAVIVTLDWLLTARQERRELRRAVQAQLDLIDAEMRSSVGRLATELVVARHAMRREAEQEIARP